MKPFAHFPLLTLCLLAAGPVPGAPPAESPYAVPQPPFFGQVRTRIEYDRKALADTSANKTLLNAQLRSRLGFTAVPSEKVEIKVEMQDARFYGSEPAANLNPASATAGNAKGLDLLQGYVAVEEGNFKTALGRQKMSLGAGRFLSTLEWSPVSRAFDGWSFNYRMEPGNLTGLAYLVRDTSSTAVNDRQILGGLYYSHQLTPDIIAEAYGFYDQSRLASVYGGDTAQGYDLNYFGERVAGKLGVFAFEEEFIWQGGEQTMRGRDKGSAAFQLATRLGAAFGPHKLNAGLDIMSGDDSPADGDIRTYRANYYFAHALYGWMDYFAANPRYGVADYRLDGDFGFLPGPSGNPRVSLKAQYHFFAPHRAPSGADDPYGQEIDLEIHLAPYPKSNIVLGAAAFLPDANAYLLPAARLKKGQDDAPGYFLYCMPTFNF